MTERELDIARQQVTNIENQLNAARSGGINQSNLAYVEGLERSLRDAIGRAASLTEERKTYR